MDYFSSFVFSWQIPIFSIYILNDACDLLLGEIWHVLSCVNNSNTKVTNSYWRIRLYHCFRSYNVKSQLGLHFASMALFCVCLYAAVFLCLTLNHYRTPRVLPAFMFIALLQIMYEQYLQANKIGISRIMTLQLGR